MANYYYDRYSTEVTATTYSDPVYNESATNYTTYYTDVYPTVRRYLGHSFTSGTTGFSKLSPYDTYNNMSAGDFFYGALSHRLTRNIFVEYDDINYDPPRAIYTYSAYGTCTSSGGSTVKGDFIERVIGTTDEYPVNGYQDEAGTDYWYIRRQQKSSITFWHII